ncbi:MAG TPA: ATP-binding protein, partial [Methylococcaceae bacterium]|nr:ATP-binding protein [Methylococcaceae bacterium]
HGQIVLGEKRDAPPPQRIPLRGQLEPVGYLEAEGAANARPVADLLEILLFVSAKYLMASDLHLRAVEEDYAELQREHEALQESEIRYKQLAENLEQRVNEQVKTLETAQRQIFASEKLASVGRLAAGVAHEINTPLGFIKSNLSTALTYLEDLGRYGETLKSDPAEARELWRKNDLDFVIEDFTALARESLDGVNRVAKIVADLRGFARVDEGGEHKADANAIVREVCDVAAARVKERIRVVLDLPQVPWVRCDPARLGQVVYNLLANAIDAIPGEGEIAFSTAVDGDKVLIRVRDTGGGIPDEVAPYIFDLFFTTKDVGQGMGMGLSFCHDVIRGYGGSIAVESRVGEGSTFTVTLPAADGGA